MISIEQIDTPEQIDAVRDLVHEFTDLALTLDPAAMKAHDFEGLEQQLADLPGICGPPDGAFLLATVDGAPAGCVAYFNHGNEVCEVKRMYVRPQFRGIQLSEKLTRSLIDRARARGYRKMVLSTFHKLKAAQALYAKIGFVLCAPTIDLPATYEGKVVFMELGL
jgi:GNAT superfamily N-acetyltransferase